MPEPAKEPRLAVVPVRMRLTALGIIDGIAKQEGRTRGDVIRRLLAEAIDTRNGVKPR